MTTDNPFSSKQLLQQLEWRYATKVFDSTKQIPAETWQALEAALVLTPSSYGLQPWKFIVITDRHLKEQLLPHAWGQKQVVDCSHLVVIASKLAVDEAYVDKFLNLTATVRHQPIDSVKGYREMIVGDVVKGPRSQQIGEWSARQAYIALGNLMTVAALLGVDACPMEGFVPAEFDQILGLMEKGFTAAVVCATGYRSENDKYAQMAKIRFAPDEVVERR